MSEEIKQDVIKDNDNVIMHDKSQVVIEKKSVTKDVPEEQDFSNIGPVKFRIRLLRGNQPFWLPKGSMRALFTMMILATALFCVVHKIEITDFLKDLTFMVLGVYFGSRMSFEGKDTEIKGDEEK